MQFLFRCLEMRNRRSTQRKTLFPFPFFKQQCIVLSFDQRKNPCRLNCSPALPLHAKSRNEGVKRQTVQHTDVVPTVTPTYWPKDGICAWNGESATKVHRKQHALILYSVQHGQQPVSTTISCSVHYTLNFVKSASHILSVYSRRNFYI